MREAVTRRDWLALSGLAVGAMAVRSAADETRAVPAGPAEPVSVAKVRSYDEDLTAQFKKMFDQIGGIGNQIKGKTVGIKVNLTGGGGFPGYTAGDTHWVHPRVVGAVVSAFGSLGAKRIRILESAGGRKPGYKLEDKLLSGGWDVAALRNAAPLVEFEDTNALGEGKQYSLLKVRSKPYLFPAFQLNHSYEDCDFFVSLGKMKNHEEMGLTICIKNLFGITPLGVYRNLIRSRTATKVGGFLESWSIFWARARSTLPSLTASSPWSAARARGSSVPSPFIRESSSSAKTA
jgi:Domain of unknown function (DUF362)